MIPGKLTIELIVNPTQYFCKTHLLDLSYTFKLLL